MTLRLLAGAKHLDMIWYGVQLSTVHGIFVKMLTLIDIALPNDEIFNFNPGLSHFLEELKNIAGQWSTIQEAKKQANPSKGAFLALL